MFYLSSLTKDISLYPKDISSNVKNIISVKIRELEGKVIGNYGYVVSIVEFNQASKGKIDNETGVVNYKIMYKAITLKPVKGEILDTIPIYINEHGFFCNVGPIQIFVSQHKMIEWKYNSEENTWNLGTKKITIGKIVQIEIIAVRINSDEITCLGKINIP